MRLPSFFFPYNNQGSFFGGNRISQISCTCSFFLPPCRLLSFRIRHFWFPWFLVSRSPNALEACYFLTFLFCPDKNTTVRLRDVPFLLLSHKSHRSLALFFPPQGQPVLGQFSSLETPCSRMRRLWGGTSQFPVRCLPGKNPHPERRIRPSPTPLLLRPFSPHSPLLRF